MSDVYDVRRIAKIAPGLYGLGQGKSLKGHPVTFCFCVMMQ